MEDRVVLSATFGAASGGAEAAPPELGRHHEFVGAPRDFGFVAYEVVVIAPFGNGDGLDGYWSAPVMSRGRIVAIYYERWENSPPLKSTAPGSATSSASPGVVTSLDGNLGDGALPAGPLAVRTAPASAINDDRPSPPPLSAIARQTSTTELPTLITQDLDSTLKSTSTVDANVGGRITGRIADAAPALPTLRSSSGSNAIGDVDSAKIHDEADGLECDGMGILSRGKRNRLSRLGGAADANQRHLDILDRALGDLVVDGDAGEAWSDLGSDRRSVMRFDSDFDSHDRASTRSTIEDTQAWLDRLVAVESDRITLGTADLAAESVRANPPVLEARASRATLDLTLGILGGDDEMSMIPAPAVQSPPAATNAAVPAANATRATPLASPSKPS